MYRIHPSLLFMPLMVGANRAKDVAKMSCGFCEFYFKLCTKELGKYPKDIKSRENVAGKFFYATCRRVFADPRNA